MMKFIMPRNLIVAMIILVLLNAIRPRPQVSHLDHISGFLGNHDGGNVRVACHNGRHDAAISHSQIFHSMNSQLMIDNCHRI